MPTSFDSVIQMVKQNNLRDQSLLLPYLCAETIEERLRNNYSLASACLAAKNLVQAKIFIERAWLFSDFSEKILPLYEEINRLAGDLEALREAYKRVGINCGRIGGIEAALPYFIKSMYTYVYNGKGDSYKYDFEVLRELEQLAEPFRFSPILRMWLPGVRKLRIAYLVYGAASQQSVVVKIMHSIGCLHDRERFEFAFFIPENELVDFTGSAFLRENIRQLEEIGEIVAVTNGTTQATALLDTAKQIFDYSPDILVTSALLADFKQYYIASLRPAPFIIGLTLGPPQQFSAPIQDWSITFDPHALMDSMSGCSLIPLEVDLPPEDGPSASRDTYGIPGDAVVIIAAGRASKFLYRAYWETLAGLMRLDTKVYLIIIGLTNRPPFLDEVITGELVGRTVLLGWLDDYIALLRISDIMVDTYPSGGGITLVDAMALGLPTVTFKNNYMHLFDQCDWSPGERVVDTPELVAERGDWNSMRTILEQLVGNKVYRAEMGNICKQKAIEKRGSPERMIRSMESVYQDVFRKAYESRPASAEPTSPSLPDTTVFREVMEKRINFWRFQEEFIQRDAVHFAAFFTRFPFIVSILLKLESVIKPSYIKRLSSYLRR